MEYSRNSRPLLRSGKQIKVLRSDRGKEYTSCEFDKFCEDEGIERQLTVAYTPQQNGVSERKSHSHGDGKINAKRERYA